MPVIHFCYTQTGHANALMGQKKKNLIHEETKNIQALIDLL